MTGVYLTIATLAFALIIQEVLNHWEVVTGGLKGKAVARPSSSASPSEAARHFISSAWPFSPAACG
jgi:ABC-type branched-subunit amino acid transport system permease subunit